MGRDIRSVYAAAAAFAAAMPLVFLVPALPELAQHLAEARLGMYASLDAFRAAAHADARLGIGYVKALAVLLPGYWFVRYMAWGDAARAIRPDAAKPWLPVLAFGAATTALGLFAPPLHALLGLPAQGPARLLDAGASVSLTVLGVFLTAWSVAAPLGGGVTPVRSLALMAGSFWRTIGYTLACAAPAMALHYALGLGAVGRPGWLAAAMLCADGAAVAFLAHALAGAAFVAARHAAARRGVEPVLAAAGGKRRAA